MYCNVCSCQCTGSGLPILTSARRAVVLLLDLCGRNPEEEVKEVCTEKMKPYLPKLYFVLYISSSALDFCAVWRDDSE